MAEETVSVLERVRSSLLATPSTSGRLNVLDSPLLAYVVQMLLGPSTHAEIIKHFASHDLKLSATTLRRLRRLMGGLDEGLKAQVIALAPLPVGAHKKDEEIGLSSVQVLKKTIESITHRVSEIEAEIAEAKKDKGKVVSDKREDQLMKYYQMVVELRKQLEGERLKSEVVQSYRQGAVAICMIAVEFIKDDAARREFLEKVRDLEQRDI